MRRITTGAFVGAALALMLAGTGAGRAAADGDDGLELPGTDLAVHRVGPHPGAPATVFWFVSTGCPVVARYHYRVADLYAVFAPQGVHFLAVNSFTSDPPAEVTAWAAEHHLPFPVLLDRQQAAADRWSVEQVPYVVVLDTFGRVRYRGRIDDHTQDDLVQRRYLGDALAALVAGRPVSVVETRPTEGCILERPLPTVEAPAVTYADVAPILQRRCAGCHRPGEVAPFDLTSYANARRWARNIRFQTRAGAMPPWKPVDRGVYKAERWMPAAEIDLLERWEQAGAPLGDPARVPPPPRYAASGWRFGTPDLVLTAAPYDVPARGADEYRCYVLPTELPEDRWVVAVEHRPGNRRVVHHLIAYVDTSGTAERLDAADPAAGYRSHGTGPGFVPAGDMGGWAPGVQPEQLPAGVGRRLPAGARIVLEVHYHPNGRAERDQSSLGLYFATAPIHKQWRWLELVNPFFSIPAGAAAHVVRQRRVVPRDAHAYAVMPHMHLLGRAITVTATAPDGTVRRLVHIDDWDFQWQDIYYFAEPMALPAGTVLDLRCVYDNSAGNPNNPNHPPRPVGWGEQTTDEMALAFVSVTWDDEDLAPDAGGAEHR